MKFRIVAFVALAALISAPAVHAFEWVTIKPATGGEKVKFSIAGNDRVYYRLAPGQTMEYDIAEYDMVRVVTRGDMRDAGKDEVVYTFRIGYDSGAARLYARAAGAEEGVTLDGVGKVAGSSRTIKLDKPQEAKSLRLSLDKDASMPVFFRVQRDRFETIKEEDYVSYNPAKSNRPVKVSVRENVLNYYPVKPKGSLEVTVNGPTVIKVLTRVMMDDKMRSRIKFPLAIYEDNVLKRTVLVSTSASEVAVLPDHPDRRPTRGDDIYITVPEGKHTYTFDLPENGMEAILRFFIPEKDLAKEAKP